MFSLSEFKAISRLFAVYTANAITPAQVINRLRERNKKKEIALLSEAFERMPGYMNYTIREFIDILRLKVVIE